MRHSIRLAAPLAARLALLALTLLPASHAAAQAGGGRGPTPVTVITVKAQDVMLTATLPGRVAASAEAEVRPQVAGIVEERLFEEGAHVTKGQSLYKIDPETYNALLEQAKASVAQAQAQLKAARTEATRLLTLRDRQVVSEQALDNAIAARDSAEAGLQVARAQQRTAEINLDRTTINARLTGEIGLSRTSPGALVTASQATPLAVIRTLDPIYVDVTQSAADLLDWQRHRKGGGSTHAPDREVRLMLADGSMYAQTGHLTAAEPNVDLQTGVVTLRMTFANPDRLLLPGMYVQVKLPTITRKGAILVPQEAVIRDRRGRPVAWVVGKDNVLEQHDLTVVQDIGSDWVVTGGLRAGDQLVIKGFQKTQPGATVKPEPLQSPQTGDAAKAE